MPISSEDYRNALRHFPAGVTIVTVKTPGLDHPHGLTVSAFASVSPEPPLIMVAIDHRSYGYELMEKSGTVFAVNILGQEMSELSNRFAWTKDEDRFAEGNWTTAVTGAPVLEDALAWLDCTVYSRHHVRNNTIYIGEVQASNVPRPNDPPLIYWDRKYRQLDETAL